MDMRTGDTGKGQYWRVTGRAAVDAAPGPDHVVLEVWTEIMQSLSNGETQRTWEREMISIDPALARKMGQDLIDMADHAEGVDAE